MTHHRRLEVLRAVRGARGVRGTMSAEETGLSDDLLESLVGRLQQLKLQSSDPLAVQQSIREVRALWQSLAAASFLRGAASITF